MLGGDKDKSVPSTYPYLGISYKIRNPPYDTVKLIPYIEEDNEGVTGKEVKSNVIFTGGRLKI